MTSKNLDKLEGDRGSDRLLFVIKTRGPLSTGGIAAALGITGEAARQQVQRLVSTGLLVGRGGAPGAVGRPKQVWELSEAGYARFPDSHAYLTVQLLQTVKDVFGADGLEKLISKREIETRQAYQRACEGFSTIEAKVEKLAEIRTGEGYMARVEIDDSALLLIEDHCPICAAAKSCQGLCRSEMQIFKEVLGSGAQIERVEHALSGGRRCVYRIWPLAAP